MLPPMKLIAAAILAGALVIALAIMSSRSDPAVAEPGVPHYESSCLMAGGFWVDEGPDPSDGSCVLP
jgi:hypothetical protein